MIEHSERSVDEFAAAGADILTVHQEACPHLHRVLAQIREAGAAAGSSVFGGDDTGARFRAVARAAADGV